MVANEIEFYPISVEETGNSIVTSTPSGVVMITNVSFEYDMFESKGKIKPLLDFIDPYKLHPNIYQARIDRIERLEFIYDQYRYSLRGDYRAMMYANNLIGCI